MATGLRKAKDTVEIVAAVIGVVALVWAAMFGTVQYLDKKRDDRVKETMEFLDRYNSGAVLEARHEIVAAWLEHADEQRRLMPDSVPAEAFQQFVLRVIEQEKLMLPIATMHDFFGALNTCIANAICERSVAIGIFQRDAHNLYTQHYAYIEAERKRRKDASFGSALQRVARMK